MRTIKKMVNDTFLEGTVAVSENNQMKNSLAKIFQINICKKEKFVY